MSGLVSRCSDRCHGLTSLTADDDHRGNSSQVDPTFFRLFSILSKMNYKTDIRSHAAPTSQNKLLVTCVDAMIRKAENEITAGELRKGRALGKRGRNPLQLSFVVSS